jgi:hypothetical protein
MMFGLTYEKEAFSGIVMQPGRLRLHEQIAYRFVFGGFLWAFFVSGKGLPAALLPCTLQPPGTAVFLVRDARDMDNLASFSTELIRIGRSPK